VASRTITPLQDDIDGSNAARTVRLTIDGTEDEIDLSRMWARPRCLGSRHHPTVLKDLVDILTRYPGKARHLRNGQDAMATVQRFRDLRHGELGGLVRVHAVCPLRTAPWRRRSLWLSAGVNPSIAVRLILITPRRYGLPVLAV
jgi:hypothetical protein